MALSDETPVTLTAGDSFVIFRAGDPPTPKIVLGTDIATVAGVEALLATELGDIETALAAVTAAIDDILGA